MLAGGGWARRVLFCLFAGGLSELVAEGATITSDPVFFLFAIFNFSRLQLELDKTE